MKFNRLLKIVLASTILGLLYHSPCIGDDATGIELSASVGDWCVHEATGRVFVSSPDDDSVIEYMAGGILVRKFAVGAQPRHLMLKRDQLIVACQKTHALDIIDLSTNQLAGSVSLHGDGPYALFCSDVDNDLVYAICNTGSAWWDGEVFQVDLKTQSIRNQTKVQPWGQSHPIHVAMSRDGKWIVPDARGASSPSGADLMKVDEEKFTFTQVRDYHSSFGIISPSPLSQHWTFGNDLYSLDIQRKIRSFSGSPVAIHPHLDLAASLSSTRLLLERFSDARNIVGIELKDVVIAPTPEQPDKANNNVRGKTVASAMRQSRSQTVDPTIQFDLKNNQIFVGLDKVGYWVDLKSLDKPLEPLSVLVTPAVISVEQGKELRLPIKHTNEKDKSLTVELLDGPKGARIEKRVFRWTPTNDDAGFQIAKFNLLNTDKNVKDSRQTRINVSPPSIELGFPASQMRISSDENRIILWGPSIGQERRHPAHTGSDEVVVIDLKTRKVLAKKTMPQGIRFAAIDDQYAYIAPASGDVFYRLNHELAVAKRMFFKSTPTAMQKISDDRLAVITQTGLQIFDVQTMKEITPTSRGKIQHVSQMAIYPLNNAYSRVNHQVIRSSDGAVVQIKQTSLPTLVSTSNRGSQHSSVRGMVSQSNWGRLLLGNQLVDSSGGRVVSIDHETAAALSDQWPVLVIAKKTYTPNVTTTLRFLSIVDGSVVQSMILNEDDEVTGSQRHSHANRTLLMTSGNKVFYIDGDHLVFTEFPDAAKLAEVRTHFSPEQTTEISADRVATIELRVSGPKANLSFRLLQEFPGVKLDESSGTLTIQAPELWKQMISKEVSNSSHSGIRGRSNSPIDRATNADAYEAATDKKLPANQFAAQIPIAVSFQDDEGRGDQLNFHVVVTGDRTNIDKQVQEQRAAQETARVKYLAEQQSRKDELERQRTQATMQASNIKESSDKVGERIENLEVRMRRMEATLDAILLQLEEKKQPQP